MAAVSVVMSNRRGSAARKRSLRLPIIAPKDEVPAVVSCFNASDVIKSSIPRSRVRFPPRSRTGCWTCRSRKVKCDENHPQCNQCTRLGHDCDYRPRLCFRDDTRRVMERMSEIKTTGNAVWDPELSTYKKGFTIEPIVRDVLPSFPMLTSDEEREKKAQASVPGTYHVVYVPESFANLPQYTENSPCEPLASSFGYENNGSDLVDAYDLVEFDDPNVVVLKRFRDVRPNLHSSHRNSSLSPVSEIQDSSSAVSTYTSIPGALNEDSKENSLGPKDYESLLLGHFRNVVWANMIPVANLSDGPEGHRFNAQAFENEVVNFPPLLQAIMAISALSLSRQGGAQVTDAVQYHTQAFSALESSFRSNESLLSDGLFLTQFLIIIYEISRPNNLSGLLTHHISRILHICHLRRSVFERERYPFIPWYIATVDLYLLLSGKETGEFIQAAIGSNLLPGPESFLHAEELETSILAHPEAQVTLPIILRLQYDHFVLALRLGIIAAELRRLHPPNPKSGVDPRLEEVEGLRNAFRHLWNTPEANHLLRTQDGLPKQLKDIIRQISIVFHTSMLFSYTSLWPGQDCAPSAVPEIQHHAEIILRIMEASMPTNRGSVCHFDIFPIFLSGAVAPLSGIKIRAWELLSLVEEKEMGYGAASMCYMLQAVYERQMQHPRREQHTMGWDWVEVLAEHRAQAVYYG